MHKQIKELRKWLVAGVMFINCWILFNWILRFKSQLIPVSRKSAMVFAPHQDDETLGCGGLIASKCKLKVPIEVVFLTNGCLGRPYWIDKENIIDFRQQEAINALKNLGLPASAIHFLGLPDGRLKQLPEEIYQDAIAQLIEMLKSFQPGEIYVPSNQDRHPDHEATYDLLKQAIILSGVQTEIFQYPIWMLWYNPLSPQKKWQSISQIYRISIATVQERKKIAIACYPSQTADLPPGFLTRFLSPYEIFMRN